MLEQKPNFEPAIEQTGTSPKKLKQMPRKPHATTVKREVPASTKPKAERPPKLTLAPDPRAKSNALEQSREVDQKPTQIQYSEADILPVKSGFDLANEHQQPDPNSDAETYVMEHGANEVFIETPDTKNTEYLQETTQLREAAIEANEGVIAHIQEMMVLPEEVIEQTEVFLEVLPEVAQLCLAEYIRMAEPEAVEKMETLVINIAQAAERLHILTTSERGDSPEAEQIEELLVEWYSEMLSELGIEADEQTIKNFIIQVRSGAYGQSTTEKPQEYVDEGTHERKSSDDGMTVSPSLRSKLLDQLGKLPVALSVAA